MGHVIIFTPCVIATGLIPDPSALPQVATCFNTIILPHYPSKKILKEKLHTALEYGSLSFGRH
jgi:hypothetical protein